MKLPDFRSVMVAVIGDVILDVFSYHRKDRRCAEDLAASCWLEQKITRQPGGIGTTARCVRQLHGQAAVYGVSGVGYTSTQLARSLHELSIAINLVTDRDRHTSSKERLVDVETGRYILVKERHSREPVKPWLANGIVEQLKQTEANVLVVSDYDRGVVTPELGEGLSAYSRDSGKPLLVDARPRPKEWYKAHFTNMHLITPNLREAEGMIGRSIRTESEIDAAGRELRDVLQCNVLITLSEHGARLYEKGGEERVYVVRNHQSVVCVAGAGDALIATIALCLGAGMSLVHACEIGQFAAGITVALDGTDVATRADLEEALEGVELK